jgi:hypothetical protein
VISLRRSAPASRPSPIRGWPPASPDPGSGDGARLHPGTRPAPTPRPTPQTLSNRLTRPDSFRDADLAPRRSVLTTRRRGVRGSGLTGGECGIGKAAPRGTPGCRSPVQCKQLVVAGVLHYVIVDHTRLEGLNVSAMGTWELSKATSGLPKLARVLLVGRQRRKALTDAGLVRRLASTRNAGVQSKRCQKRYRENNKETLQRPSLQSLDANHPPHPPARRRRCPPSVPGCTTHVGMSMAVDRSFRFAVTA